MRGPEAYKAFIKLQSQINEIKTIYSNLKSDIKDMSDSQIKSQSQKILTRLSKINLDLFDEYLEDLKDYRIHDTVETQVKQLCKDVDKIKEFIYSLDEKEEEEEVIPKQEDTDKTTPLDKKLDYIRDKYTFLQKEVDTTDTTTIIRDAKRLETILSRLNFEDLPEGDYDEMVSIKNEVSKMIRNLQGVETSEKYGPYIHEPLVKLILGSFTHDNEEAKTKAATVLDFIEDPERIHMFEPAIRRIIAKKMTPKEFRSFYTSVMVMMRGERKFESFGDYKERYGFFYLI